MTMREKLTISILTVALVLTFATWGPFSHKASAIGGSFSNANFVGGYAVQFTGDVFVPAPFDKFNGKFFRTARLVADGFGNLDVTAVGNYGGSITREKFSGTYNITPEGVLTITINNLALPFAPNAPTVLGFDGV